MSAAPRQTVVPFTAGDGFPCNLVHVESRVRPWKGPVLLVHGAGVRADIFRAPVRTTIVDALLAAGYDVWLENWRASIDFAPNRWTLDQAAAFDHPKAVDAVCAATGSETLKAIVHCQGSTSFTMSLIAGLLPKVTVVVSNAVSLCPVVPAFSGFKLDTTLGLLKMMVDYLNPAWGLEAPTWQARAILALVRASHHECGNDVCKLVSFTYGSGRPALWSHENLDEATHDWLKKEFAAVPLTFFDQIRACVKAGRLVSMDPSLGLPADFGARPPQTDARIAFFAGAENRCFLAESQRRAFAHFSRFRKDHALHVLDGYGHLDVFMGTRAAGEVFPLMLTELDGTS